MKQLIFLTTVTTFVLAAVTSRAQQTTPKERAVRQINNHMRIPPDFEDCDSMAGVAIIPVKQNKVGEDFIFSAGFRPSMQEEVKKCFKRINIALITRDYFRLSPNASYYIKLPIGIGTHMDGCITAPQGKSLSGLAREFRPAVKGQVYKMDRISMTRVGKPIICIFTGAKPLAETEAEAWANNPARLSAKPQLIATRPFLP